jgi:hypothetical protein
MWGKTCFPSRTAQRPRPSPQGLRCRLAVGARAVFLVQPAPLGHERGGAWKRRARGGDAYGDAVQQGPVLVGHVGSSTRAGSPAARTSTKLSFLMRPLLASCLRPCCVGPPEPKRGSQAARSRSDHGAGFSLSYQPGAARVDLQGATLRTIPSAPGAGCSARTKNRRWSIWTRGMGSSEASQGRRDGCDATSYLLHSAARSGSPDSRDVWAPSRRRERGRRPLAGDRR